MNLPRLSSISPAFIKRHIWVYSLPITLATALIAPSPPRAIMP